MRVHDWSGVSLGGLERVERWLARVEARPGVQRGLAIPEARERKSQEQVEQAVDYARGMLT